MVSTFLTRNSSVSQGPGGGGSGKSAAVATTQRQIRIVLALAGVATLGLLAATMLARGVDRVEVIAAALYIAVFLGVVFADVIGGASAALAASAIYMLLRLSAIEILGTGRFAGLILVRMFSYLAFGLIGGLAWTLLRDRLKKLESFDSVDDATRLLNARGLAQIIDHEVARGRRYEETFVVSTLQLPMSAWENLSRKGRKRALGVLGSTATKSLRSVDRVGVINDGRSLTLVVLSPQTSLDGSTAITSRITESLSNSLLPMNVALGRKIDHHHLLFPRDNVEIAVLRQQLHDRVALDYPAAESVGQSA